jgi:hypothetical protein
MTVKTDPALYGSDFARNPLDRYFTEPRVSEALIKRLSSSSLPLNANIWEPCCGRGDIAGVLHNNGHHPFMSDIDISEVDPRAVQVLKLPVVQHDFLSDNVPDFVVYEDIHGIITNPPFGDLAEKVIRQALTFQNLRYFAFLLRSEWNHGKSRLDLFTKQPFAKEIVLTWRPRWDWWMTDEQKRAAKVAAGKDPDVDHSPRHNFSWFVWDRGHVGAPTQEWATR